MVKMQTFVCIFCRYVIKCIRVKRFIVNGIALLNSLYYNVYGAYSYDKDRRDEGKDC